MLFGCYRRGDANDPDTYVAAVAAVLARYSSDLIREVTDPNTGIQTTEKFATFMPNAGELKIYCDAVDARKDRIQKLGELPRVDFSRPRLAAPPPGPGYRAKVFVPASNSRYAQLLEWSKTADPLDFKFESRPGIWVSYAAWERPKTLQKRAPDDTLVNLSLSEEAQRMMASLDAERSHNLPIDHAGEAAE